jgi:hypothetical protein
VTLTDLKTALVLLLVSSCSENRQTPPKGIETQEVSKAPAGPMTVYASPPESMPGNIERLAPAAFTDLPAPVIQELERRGCTIPQVDFPAKPSNVVRGRFTNPTQVDIAVLCSVEGISSILVFRNSSVADVGVLAPAPDAGYLQGVGVGRIGYSRGIGIATAENIQSYYEAYGSLKPPPLDHEGINDAFVEKASTVWYWHEGKWLELQGAD